MYGLKKIFQLLLIGMLVFSVNEPLKGNLAIAQHIDPSLSDCIAAPHAYDLKFEAKSSATKTLSGKIANVLQKKDDRLYNLAFMTNNFDEPQTKNIYFLLAEDNIKIEGNLVFSDNTDRKVKNGSFIPYKKEESNLQLTYTMAGRKIKRISNSGDFKISNLKINEAASGLIVPVSFKLDFNGEFTCPKDGLEKVRFLNISGFVKINPTMESLIAIR